MKTHTKTLLMATLTSLFALGLFGCGSNSGSSGSSSGTAAVVGTGYTYNSYGQCVQTSTGTVAPSNTYCSATNTGYTYGANGQCVSTTTGQIAPSATYCQTGYGQTGYGQTGYGQTGYGQTYGQCYGFYYYTNGQPAGTCNGANCRGWTLISQNGQQVTCQ